MLRLIVMGMLPMLVGSAAFAAACDGFSDVSDSDTAYCTAVTYLKNRGVTLGCGNGTIYCPNDYVTRLQMALFLQRFGRGDPTNTLDSPTSYIFGGEFNTSSGRDSVVLGGHGNSAALDDAIIVGGGGNTADGAESVVLGGSGNAVHGFVSVAAGYGANAENDYCVVFSLWEQVPGPGMSCGGVPNVFRIGADHGFSVDYFTKRPADGGGVRYVYIGDFSPGKTIGAWNGAYLSDAGAWTSVSDRAVKHHFTTIDTADVLARVASMPIERWEYRVEHDVTHIGPVAQDFYAAFNVGADDRTMTSIDETGVALAAIQGLNAKLEAQLDARDAMIAEQARALSVLQARVDSLERLPTTR